MMLNNLELNDGACKTKYDLLLLSKVYLLESYATEEYTERNLKCV